MTLLSPHSLGDPEFAFINPSPPSLSLPTATPTPACLSVFRPLDFLVFPYSSVSILSPDPPWILVCAPHWQGAGEVWARDGQTWALLPVGRGLIGAGVTALQSPVCAATAGRCRI